MKRISFICIFALWLAVTDFAIAAMPTSFRQPHPLNWKHATPVGEMPGWVGDFWTFFEVSNANVWNAPLTMIDRRTGAEYRFEADYEQVSAILELGTALTERLALSLEVPFAFRGGGFLDNIIDGFHVFVGNRRFNRQFYPEDQNKMSTATDGVDYYNDKYKLNNVSNLKPKLKWWLWKWEGKTKGSCPCGLSLSAQVKVPVQDEKFGGTTGEVDYSGLLHFGIPVGESSAIWLTAAYTRLGDDPSMKGWPRLRTQQMYELDFDIGVNRKWGLLIQGRAQSPFLNKDHLEYYNSSSDPNVIARDRAASGWNALVHWQGAQGFGLRYRPGDTSQINVLFAEDWGFGNYDADDGVYSNNAPDFNFIIQSSFSW